MDVNVKSSIEVRGSTLPTVSPSSAPAQEAKGQGQASPTAPTSGVVPATTPSVSQQQPSKQKEMAAEQAAKAAQELQDRLDEMGTKLSFAIDKQSDSIVIQVTDQKTGKLVRQIPSQEMLDLKAKLEKLMGILFDKKV